MSCEVSIIIPSYNEEHFLPGLLESIRRHGPADAEVIVVDNGSMDNTAAVVENFGAQLVRLPRKVFPSSARNAGVVKAAGNVFVFLDADVELSGEWRAGWPDAISSLQGKPLQITGDQYHISKQPSWIERIWFAPLRDKTPTYINGGNLITTRTAFDSVRGFDERLETGEDVDFCVRAQKAGVEIRIDSDLKVFHEGYPKTLSRFIRRERWHGVGDFRSLSRLVRSKVAIATVAFIGLHAVLLASAVVWVSTGRGGLIAGLSAASIGAICLLGCVQKFPKASLSLVIQAVPIMYFYYVGRSLSLWDVIRTRLFTAAGNSRHR